MEKIFRDSGLARGEAKVKDPEKDGMFQMNGLIGNLELQEYDLRTSRKSPEAR